MTDRAAVMAWRRAERARLIAARLATSVALRQQASARIAAQLDQRVRAAGWLPTGSVVSGYWPLRGEPDLRPWLAGLHAQGFVCAMPVVERKGEPLVFRQWWPGCAMEPGFWDIPVPAGTPTVGPTLLLAPVVGFDPRNFRLGYGGGYFDRTLAALAARGQSFRAVGVGYADAALPSIQPLPHDIPLHAVVTERA